VWFRGEARFIRNAAWAIVLCLLASKTAPALKYPVPPNEVRAAYYLGQSSDHEKLDAFLKQYVQYFPYPTDKPDKYVESVRFSTPYEQIVLRSKFNRETALEADDAYKNSPGLVKVDVVIGYRWNYGGPIPSIDGFKFSVSQDKTIEPNGAPTVAICYPDVGTCANLQVDVSLQFDPQQFGQKVTTITVENPQGQIFQTKFNLARLK
jgi:hypothetical protein